jgi:hypothetical protein
VQVHRLSDGAHIRTIGSKGSGNGQFGVSNSLRARLCAHNARGHMCAYMYQICQQQTAPPTFYARITTSTAAVIIVEVKRSLAPHAADRFYSLSQRCSSSNAL